MKYFCSECSRVLSKDDLKLSGDFTIGKLYCFDCLKKDATKLTKLPKNHEKYEAYLKRVEEELVAIAKEASKWEKY